MIELSSIEQFFKDQPLQLISLVTAVIGGVWALTQWRTEQTWKRLQATFERIRSFDETPGTRNAMMILKSPRAEIPLWDPSMPPDKRYEWVTWQEAAKALQLDGYRSVELSSKAGAIRNSFEDFFNRMTQIQIFLESGLLTTKQVKHLVEPWIVRIKTVEDDGLSTALRHYMKVHHKYAVIHLFDRPEFNRRVPPRRPSLPA
jgi:hypothetical protein